MKVQNGSHRSVLLPLIVEQKRNWETEAAEAFLAPRTVEKSYACSQKSHSKENRARISSWKKRTFHGVINFTQFYCDTQV